MNVFMRRCGCGAVFKLVHLRDRSAQCGVCQRKQASKLAAEAALCAIEKFVREGFPWLRTMNITRRD